MYRASLVFPLLATACGADPTEAERVAAELTGGTVAGEAARLEEDGHDLWQLSVSMSNGAELEVLIHVEDDALYEIADTAGPFDYAMDPLPGQLTYDEGLAVARGEVEGEQEAWEVKDDGEAYFYEFYLREAGDQLWEIKLWADSGEVFSVEGKDEVD